MGTHILLLGASGFIGQALAQEFLRQGHTVRAFARTPAPHHDPRLEWIYADFSQFSTEDWIPFLNVDAVINASGALQDTPDTNLETLHHTMLVHLVDALTTQSIIQISAAGSHLEARTKFLRSKARGDQALQAYTGPWYILRPTMVLAPHAYGGSALLQASAALPLAYISVFSTTRVQVCGLHDLTKAVMACIEGRICPRIVADITEENGQSLEHLTQRLRQWMGYPAWRARVSCPSWMLRLLGGACDGLSWLGWKSPLRTSALKTLQDGVVGDASAWKEAGGHQILSLEDLLAQQPASIHTRIGARSWIFLPFSIGILSLFWLISGIIGFMSFSAAVAVLGDSAFSFWSVFLGSVIDISLGLGILYRPWTKSIAILMVLTSLGYLLGACLWAPWLWLDPLGPLVKVFPSLTLALLPAWILEDR